MITIILPCGHDQGIACTVYGATTTTIAKEMDADGNLKWNAFEVTDYEEAKYFCAECGEFIFEGADDDLRNWLLSGED